jgi:ferredoxin
VAGYLIVIAETGQRFFCGAGMDLIEAQRRSGLSALPSQCRRGGCGLCRVRIVSGDFDFLPMSSGQVSADERRAGVALACRVRPCSAMVISIGDGPRKFLWPRRPG